ncbi:hypothetical protein VNO77_11959 [Canavalia gladiata]|uniref:Uncharacterized protein n=1 Tax=Canavalia gladiata TaxID=3824 RepID=A0AAN9QMJ7_CANGL
MMEGGSWKLVVFSVFVEVGSGFQSLDRCRSALLLLKRVVQVEDHAWNDGSHCCLCFSFIVGFSVLAECPNWLLVSYALSLSLSSSSSPPLSRSLMVFVVSEVTGV